MEEEVQHHLLVETEVSAKYRGAFCEAKIKSVKKSLIFKVSNKKDGKVYNVSEDVIKGSLKIGSIVEVQLPDTSGWHEVVLLSAKDKSIYTVEFDDGDVRTLSRGSLCLQGVRHFAEGDTLDQLPLTDPENFGTPVLNSKRKAKRKVTQSLLDHDDVESDDIKSVDNEPVSKRKASQSRVEPKEDVEDESDEKKRERWLADPNIGKLVLVEPTDKRKHWYPALCVNPMCIEDYDEVRDNQMVVRSFKSGKFFTVSRCERLTRSNIPSKVEPVWKDVLESSFLYEENGSIPDVWKADLNETENSNKSDDVECNKEDDEKRQEFLEQLYKFMDDRGTPISKPPVLGYKDLDLYLLYNLVQAKSGFYRVGAPSDWREIYSDLGIPKITQAAGHHAKMAYSKYLLCFEEYLMSFDRNNTRQAISSKSSGGKKIRSSTPNKSPRRSEDPDVNVRRASRRRKISESLSVADENECSPVSRDTKRARKSKAEKRDSDLDDASSTASSDKSTPKCKESSDSEKKQGGRKKTESTSGKKQVLYKVGDRLKVKYGKEKFKLYTAKVMEMKMEDGEACYLVHYTGYNSRHDEWILGSKISGLQNDATFTPKCSSRRPKSPMSDSPAPSIDSPQPPAKPETSPSSSLDSEPKKDDQSKLVEEFQEKSKFTQKNKRMRRRSTSSSTPPPLPQPPSSPPKRAASVEKLVPTKQEKSSKDETTSSDEKQDKSSSGVSTGLFPVVRRTSGRRSKSPAYLKESALYGLTKRKRYNSAANDSNNNLELDNPLDTDDISSETSSRSFNSSTSETSRSSPLTIWSEQDSFDKNKKLDRKRMKTKSGDQKLTQIEEELPSLVSIDAYDNFDEEVPSIELEKTADSGRKKVKSPFNEISDPSCSEKKSGDTCEPGSDHQSSPAPSNLPSSSDQASSSPPVVNLPSDKVLVDNTPQSTPGNSPKKSTDENEPSLSNCVSPASEDSISPSSNQPEQNPSNDEEKSETAKSISTEDDTSNKVESDSDGEEAKKRKINKKKNKKKKRPVPPRAPVPLLVEELAKLNSDERINTMLQRMDDLRKLYQQLKQEVSWIDKKRKRAKRKEQEANEQTIKKSSPQHKSGASESVTCVDAS